MKLKKGTLICTKCNDKFKITKGIPRFVVDVTKDFVRTEMAFSAKWKNHHRNHHAKDWVNWQKNWFLERFDWKSIKQFNTFLSHKILSLMLEPELVIVQKCFLLTNLLLYLH